MAIPSALLLNAAVQPTVREQHATASTPHHNFVWHAFGCNLWAGEGAMRLGFPIVPPHLQDFPTDACLEKSANSIELACYEGRLLHCKRCVTVSFPPC